MATIFFFFLPSLPSAARPLHKQMHTHIHMRAHIHSASRAAIAAHTQRAPRHAQPRSQVHAGGCCALMGSPFSFAADMGAREASKAAAR